MPVDRHRDGHGLARIGAPAGRRASGLLGRAFLDGPAVAVGVAEEHKGVPCFAGAVDPVWALVVLDLTDLYSPVFQLSPGGPGSTMKHEMPLVPAGASGTLASTKWTMLSARSCSP